MAQGTTVNLRLLIQATNKAAKQVTSLQGQLNEVSKAAEKLAGKSKKAGSEGANAMKKFGASTSGIKAKLDGIKASVEGIGSAGLALLGVGVSLATTAFFPIKAAADFEAAMSKVTAVTTGAVEKFDELKGVASELGRTTKFTATEAAQGMVFLGQAGFEASEVISGIGPALNLAIAAGISLGESADIATNIVSAMRLPVEDLTNATDILSNTTASANTNLLQLADAMAYAAPLAAAAGIELEEVAAVIGVLGNNGIQASQAGTAVRGMLRSLAAPTKAATEVLNDLGVEIRQNADGSLNLTAVLHELAEAQLTTAQANKLFGRFAAAGALAVTANISELDKLIEANYNAAGATERMAKIMKDNVKGAFVELTSALDGLKRGLAGPLLGAIKSFLQGMSSLVTGITELLEKFPVLTKLFGIVFTAVTALTLAMAGLLIAISSVGFAAGHLSKILGTQLVISMLAYGKALKTTIVLMGAAETRALGMSRIFYALGASVRWVGLKLKALWGVIVAHPILAVLAVIGLLLVAMAEWSARNKRLIVENKKLAGEMGTLHGQFTLFEEKIAKAKEGSKKFTAQMLSMRERLKEVAKNQESLNLEATKAAQSIDEYTGKVLDGGKALKEYGERVKDVGLKAMREQLDGINVEVDLMQGKVEGITQAWYNFIRGLKIIRTILPGMTYTMANFRKEEREAWIALQRQMESSRRQYIKMLDTMGRFDMTLPKAEAQAFFEIIEGRSKESADAITALYETMQLEISKAKEEAESFDALTLDEAKQNVNETVEEVKRLNEELYGASLLVDDAVAAWNKLTEGEKANATELRAQVKGLLEYKLKLSAEERAEAKKLNTQLRVQREQALQEVEDNYNDELRILERNLKIKKIQQFQFDEEEGKLNVKKANERVKALSGVLDAIAASGKFELKEAEVTRKAFQGEMKKVSKASKDLGDTRTIHAHNVAETIRAINQEAARDEVSLLAEGEKKFRALEKIEIDSLRARAKAKGISLDAIANKEAAINKSTQRKIDDYNRGVEEKRKDADIDRAKSRADTLIDGYEQAFKAGELNVEEYVAKSVKAQTDAIDAQITVLEARLDDARKRFKAGTEEEAVVIDLQLAVDEAKGDRGKAEKDGANLGAKLLQQKKQNELAIESTLLQGKLGNLRVYQDGLEAMAQEELNLLKNKHQQELLQMEINNVDKQKIRERELQQIEAERLKKEELDKRIFLQRQDWAQQSADTMASIFGDLYELSGQKAKQWFYLEKAAAIARVIISTQSAAMKAMDLMGPIAGKIQAALIYIQGATSIAKISAQNLAEGGEVKGKSPHKRADNIKANLTAEEWVMPVDAVRKYGKKAMAGLQNMVFPTEVFRNYRLPRLQPAMARTGFASGGEAVNRKDTMGTTKTKPIVAPPQPINIVNVVDPGELDRYLTSSAGQNAILNVLSSRKEVVRRVLK